MMLSNALNAGISTLVRCIDARVTRSLTIATQVPARPERAERLSTSGLRFHRMLI